MADRITFDDAFSPIEKAGRITFDDAIAEREVPAAESGRVFQRLPEEPLPAKNINFGASFKANLVQYPGTQRRVIADSMFPGDPSGIERVGMMDGAAVYVDEEDQLRRVSPKWASGAAIALANAPEMVGAMAGAPAGVLGSTLGAVGARGMKRGLTALVFDEPQTIAGNAIDLAGEAALNVGFGLAGKGIAKFGGRGKVVDFSPRDLKASEAVREQVKKTTGIDLDLAQASGDRKLIALRAYTARYPGKSADLIQAADDATEGQFEKATAKVLDTIAKSQPSEVAGANGVNAAQLVIKTARENVYNEARPIYEAAYKAVPVIDDPQILEFLELPYFGQAFKSGQKLAKLEGAALAKDAPPDLRSLDYTKRLLDDQIEVMTSAGKRQQARALQLKRDEFVKAIDAIPNSQWQTARRRYGEMIAERVAPLEEGPVGVLATITNPRHATAAAKIFGDANVSAQQILNAKSAIVAQNPEAWNGLVRQWIGQKWNKALKETQSGEVINAAGKFRQAVFGTPQDKERLTAMLPKGAAKDFEDLMFAAERLSSTPIGGSNTMRDTEIKDQLKGTGAVVFRWLTSPRQAVKEAAEQRALEQGTVAITEAMLNPMKRAQLRQVVKMKPSTEQALQLAAIISGQSTQRALSGDDVPIK